MSNLRLFGLSVFCTMVVGLVYLSVQRWNELRHQTKLTRIANHLFLASQLRPENMSFLRSRRIRAIVDMRPDGEAPDQPTSAEMRSAATATHIEFHYIPVPHESLPDEAVASLQAALEKDAGQTVLYCRTGRRAVRLFALASASREDGPDADEILSLVRTAGFNADDLIERIDQRIAKRTKPR